MFKSLAVTVPVLFIVALAFVAALASGINSSFLVMLLIFIALSQGMNIVYGYTGYLPFGYAGFFGAGAYAFAILVIHANLSAPVALVISGLIAAGFGLALTPLFRLSGAYFAIGSLAVALILLGIIENPALTSLTNGPYGISMPQVFAPTLAFSTTLGIAILATACSFYFEHSRLGRSLRAATDDADSAVMAGIPVPLLRGLAWVVAAGIGGLAGAAFAWYSYTFFPATVFDVSYTMFPLLFVLAGGARHTIGVLLGAVVLYGLFNILGANTQEAQIFFALAIIGIMLFFPGGVAPLLNKYIIKIVNGRSN